MILSGICIYPVKSTAGLPLEEARVEPRGLEHDRRWMVVDGDGTFITGRAEPRLLSVTARVHGAGLRLEAPGHPTLTLEDARGGGDTAVTVWSDPVTARAVDRRADAWFTELLGRPCRLVHMADGERRKVDPDHARPGDTVSFADGFPLLLIGDASLDDLAARAPVPVSMRRFRPNVTVRGAEPFAEDRWGRIRIGAVEFECPKPCDRCVMTTIDPDTLDEHPQQEPLRTLAGYRRDASRQILFGVNLIPRTPGVLRVGDPVEVLA